MNFTIEKEVNGKVIDGVDYISEIVYKVYEDGTKEIACTVEYPKTTEELIESEPTQLDRIESAVSNTLDEIRAEAVDEYTLSLMENNII